MWKKLATAGGVGSTAGTGLTVLHGPALVAFGVMLGVLVVLFAVWILAITFSATAADNWAKWRAAGRTRPGPSP